MTAKSERLAYARDVLGSYLDDVKRLFVRGTKVTLIVRAPGGPEHELLLTDDDLDEVARAVDRAKFRERQR